MPSTILKLPEVLARTKLSRSQLYALIAEGAFPRQLRLACSAVGWLESEVDLFIAERVAERDAASPSSVASVASSEAASPKGGRMTARRDLDDLHDLMRLMLLAEVARLFARGYLRRRRAPNRKKSGPARQRLRPPQTLDSTCTQIKLLGNQDLSLVGEDDSPGGVQ
ncbi:AlpA family phage regulatory protein [Lysobacter sp. A6]|uniref:AlpA family phage regulatory protein n=1 Tax=Noviluteimonas lactosilytica TaxID=2888523 RepID=A0ABS8JDP4_9GAMM|nr:AlpA family phage regulatory protein [Lysobacter lactosilyticus]MCC8361603.1 AlpA family phage regulatory protein [Lysobacter lactosilyticus]